MIDGVRLQDFKAFKKICVHFRAFTLLAGLNGVGKSTLIQSLLLLRQSNQSGDLGLGRITLNGPLIEIGTAIDLLFADADSDQISLGVISDGIEKAFEFRVVLDETSLNEVAYQLDPHAN